MLRAETALRQSVPLNLRRALASPDRRFWLIVGLITLGGAILRVQIHDFHLPWLEKADELRLWFFGREVRGMPVPTAPAFGYSYPPLIIWLHQLLQPLTEAQGRLLAADGILDLRRVMLLFTVSGTVWFALLGRRCGGPLAGILAAAFWAFEDNFIRASALAIAESLVTPLLILSILLAVHALEAPRYWRLALASTALGLLCFLGDYRFLIAVIPGIAALVWRAWRHHRPGWQRSLLWGSAGLALTALSAVLILARLPERFQTYAQETLSAYLWDMDALFLFLRRSVELIHPLLLLLVVLLALLALFSSQVLSARAMSGPALLMVGAMLLLTAWAPAAIRPYGQRSLDDIWVRYLIPAQLMICVLLSTLMAQLLTGFQNRRLRNLSTIALLVGFLLFQFLPAQRLVQLNEPRPWPVIVRNWADDNLESSKFLVYQESSRWFNPLWGGIPYRVWFDWWKTDDIRDKSLQQWVDDYHVTWALIPLDEHDRLKASNPGKTMLDQMLLLRDFSGPESRTGTRTLLYRLWRMQHETDIRFGEHIRLS
ncbi:MAG: glycosyltransferase family 39 protein, partial [Anaerolineaceae bacterium]|nr:glycosyltransferase family 39 protein [Anaerolineaceae bacterium]